MPRVSSCDLRLAVTVTSPGVWPCSSPGAPPWPRVGLGVSVVAVCAPRASRRAGQRVSRPAWWPHLPAPRESVTLTPTGAATTALASRAFRFQRPFPHAFSRYSE